MFSADQVNMMQNNCDNIPFLMNLTSPGNALATGINLANTICDAEFDCYKQMQCIAGEIELFDFSSVQPSSWAWQITPGIEGTDYFYSSGTSSTSKNPKIVFLTAGYYSVLLMASDGLMSDTEFKQNYIRILPQYGGLPYHEGFEAYSDLSATPNWEIINTDNNTAFQINSGISHSGNQCVSVLNFGEQGENWDELISSRVDLSEAIMGDDVTLSFRYAHRRVEEISIEGLRVSISKDCGDNWFIRAAIWGDNFSTLSDTNSWAPSNQNDWTTYHITNFGSNFYVQDFIYRFEFKGYGGNNFYLDDINIYLGTPTDDLVLGIKKDNNLTDLAIYPNPVKDDLNIGFKVNATEKAEITISDIYGKIALKNTILANEGNNIISLNTNEFAAGVYIIKIDLGGANHTAKFIVE